MKKDVKWEKESFDELEEFQGARTVSTALRVRTRHSIFLGWFPTPSVRVTNDSMHFAYKRSSVTELMIFVVWISAIDFCAFLGRLFIFTRTILPPSLAFLACRSEIIAPFIDLPQIISLYQHEQYYQNRLILNMYLVSCMISRRHSSQADATMVAGASSVAQPLVKGKSAAGIVSETQEIALGYSPMLPKTPRLGVCMVRPSFQWWDLKNRWRSQNPLPS